MSNPFLNDAVYFGGEDAEPSPDEEMGQNPFLDVDGLDGGEAEAVPGADEEDPSNSMLEEAPPQLRPLPQAQRSRSHSSSSEIDLGAQRDDADPDRRIIKPKDKKSDSHGSSMSMSSESPMISSKPQQPLGHLAPPEQECQLQGNKHGQHWSWDYCSAGANANTSKAVPAPARKSLKRSRAGASGRRSRSRGGRRRRSSSRSSSRSRSSRKIRSRRRRRSSSSSRRRGRNKNSKRTRHDERDRSREGGAAHARLKACGGEKEGGPPSTNAPTATLPVDEKSRLTEQQRRIEKMSKELKDLRRQHNDELVAAAKARKAETQPAKNGKTGGGVSGGGASSSNSTGGAGGSAAATAAASLSGVARTGSGVSSANAAAAVEANPKNPNAAVGTGSYAAFSGGGTSAPAITAGNAASRLASLFVGSFGQLRQQQAAFAPQLSMGAFLQNLVRPPMPQPPAPSRPPLLPPHIGVYSQHQHFPQPPPAFPASTVKQAPPVAAQPAAAPAVQEAPPVQQAAAVAINPFQAFEQAVKSVVTTTATAQQPPAVTTTSIKPSVFTSAPNPPSATVPMVIPPKAKAPSPQTAASPSSHLNPVENGRAVVPNPNTKLTQAMQDFRETYEKAAAIGAASTRIGVAGTPIGFAGNPGTAGASTAFLPAAAPPAPAAPPVAVPTVKRKLSPPRMAHPRQEHLLDSQRVGGAYLSLLPGYCIGYPETAQHLPPTSTPSLGTQTSASSTSASLSTSTSWIRSQGNPSKKASDPLIRYTVRDLLGNGVFASVVRCTDNQRKDVLRARKEWTFGHHRHATLVRMNNEWTKQNSLEAVKEKNKASLQKDLDAAACIITDDVKELSFGDTLDGASRGTSGGGNTIISGAVENETATAGVTVMPLFRTPAEVELDRVILTDFGSAVNGGPDVFEQNLNDHCKVAVKCMRNLDAMKASGLKELRVLRHLLYDDEAAKEAYGGGNGNGRQLSTSKSGAAGATSSSTLCGAGSGEDEFSGSGPGSCVLDSLALNNPFAADFLSVDGAGLGAGEEEESGGAGVVAAGAAALHFSDGGGEGEDEDRGEDQHPSSSMWHLSVLRRTHDFAHVRDASERQLLRRIRAGRRRIVRLHQFFLYEDHLCLVFEHMWLSLREGFSTMEERLFGAQFEAMSEAKRLSDTNYVQQDDLEFYLNNHAKLDVLANEEDRQKATTFSGLSAPGSVFAHLVPAAATGKARRVLKRKHFAFLVAQSWCRQLFSALEYVHRLGFVHGDVKPDNFLVAAVPRRAQAAPNWLRKSVPPSGQAYFQRVAAGVEKSLNASTTAGAATSTRGTTRSAAAAMPQSKSAPPNPIQFVTVDEKTGKIVLTEQNELVRDQPAEERKAAYGDVMEADPGKELFERFYCGQAGEIEAGMIDYVGGNGLHGGTGDVLTAVDYVVPSTLKLCDFGNAMAASSSRPSTGGTTTAASKVIGFEDRSFQAPLWYRAPEIMLSLSTTAAGEVSTKTDCWAAGCVVFEIFALFFFRSELKQSCFPPGSSQLTPADPLPIHCGILFANPEFHTPGRPPVQETDNSQLKLVQDRKGKVPVHLITNHVAVCESAPLPDAANVHLTPTQHFTKKHEFVYEDILNPLGGFVPMKKVISCFAPSNEEIGNGELGYVRDTFTSFAEALGRELLSKIMGADFVDERSDEAREGPSLVLAKKEVKPRQREAKEKMDTFLFEYLVDGVCGLVSNLVAWDGADRWSVAEAMANSRLLREREP